MALTPNQIEKLKKIGTKLGSMISFENLQRFADYDLPSEKYRDDLIYSPKQDKWFEGTSFNETEKQEMIQAIVHYTPSDNEIKEIPRKKMTGAKLERCREFDAKNDGDEYYLGY